ncbi:MAG TPA: hypothetical protein VEV38_08585, partial [Candidatus Eremiobacteraceae bacterium]|nr:hypothetical protein [Candidatus Eremiobacteraceae bacterium]
MAASDWMCRRGERVAPKTLDDLTVATNALQCMGRRVFAHDATSLDARQGADVTPHIPAFNGFNTAFMLICASLVMLMTPGLAFFYGGL